jgi:hypothetical protein
MITHQEEAGEWRGGKLFLTQEFFEPRIEPLNLSSQQALTTSKECLKPK